MTTLIQNEQKRQKIMARMREHLVPVLEHCRGGWVGLFLQGSQNYNLDYCQVCGWDKEIEIVDDDRGKLIWKCPNCGNTDKSKMNIARRTCGYIGLNDWNQGRTQEIKERYVHLGGDE